jgi:N utilization substance protein B
MVRPSLTDDWRIGAEQPLPDRIEAVAESSSEADDLELLAEDLGKRKGRSPGRELALQVLYAAQIREAVQPLSLLGAIEGLWGKTIKIDTYTKRLLEELPQWCESIDARIAAAAVGWQIKRMPITDLNIIRIAVYELDQEPSIPVSVSINEAIDLAKKYGGNDDSYKFVNGLLGRIAQEAKDPLDKGAVHAD